MIMSFYIFLSLFCKTLGNLNFDFACQDVYLHRNWYMLDNKEYCGTYDMVDPHRDEYIVLDPEASETPPTGDDEVSLSSRILRGRRVGRNEYPWLAQLLRREALGNGPICGGSLLSKRYVLTAAHCVVTESGAIETRPLSEFVVRLGANKRLNKCDEDRICREFEDFDVEEIVIPNNVRRVEVDGSWSPLQEDIALIRLRADSGFAKGIITPVCLPKCSMLYKFLYGNKMVFAGWGAINEEPNKEFPDVLQKFYPVIKNSKQCRIAISINLDKTICSSDTTAKQSSSCGGDSGGPLMLLTKERKNNTLTHIYYQIGILAFGSRRCDKAAIPFNKDSFHTRVAHFMPWILDHIRE